MVRTLLSAKVFLAILIVLAGAYFAGQGQNDFERITIMFVTTLVALFIGTDQDDREDAARRRMLEAAKPQRISDLAEFQTFLDANIDAVLIVENAHVTHANALALQLLGANIIGKSVQIAFRHAGAIERLSDPDAQHNGRPFRLIGIGLKDQQWEMRITSLDNAQKLVFLSDKTGTQAAEKMRVDFVANASHELLTPLAAIRGFIETLNETEAGGQAKTRARFLKIMEDEASRMQALIRDLMSLSRIEAEKYRLPASIVDMDAIVKEVLAPLRNGADPRGQDVIAKIAPDLAPVMGDAGQLRQLISNIVANAMKYGTAATPVTLTLERSRSGSMLALTVTDQGEGIAPEHLPRLTERFYRVDSGRSRAIGGTGLGLSLVKHIVDGHRGHLEIKSKLGVGTAIKILLPISQAHERAAPAAIDL
jgi:two-component system, OmpR family, phosphate regulon sensor histidine kinase PhoR